MTGGAPGGKPAILRPMIRLAPLLLCLAACAHAPAADVPPESPPSGAAVELPRGLPADLAPWLRQALAAIGSRDPVVAVPWFDADNRAMQRQIGITDDAQYVVEGLGVSRAGHLAGPELRVPPDSLRALQGLERIVVTGVEPLLDANGVAQEGWLVVEGELHFAGGTRYRLWLQVLRRGDAFVIAPAVG